MILSPMGGGPSGLPLSCRPSIVKEAIDMSRYKTEHSDVPMMAKKTVITDTTTGKKAESLDWSSFQEADRKAWEALKKK